MNEKINVEEIVWVVGAQFYARWHLEDGFPVADDDSWTFEKDIGARKSLEEASIFAAEFVSNWEPTEESDELDGRCPIADIWITRIDINAPVNSQSVDPVRVFVQVRDNKDEILRIYNEEFRIGNLKC